MSQQRIGRCGWRRGRQRRIDANKCCWGLAEVVVDINVVGADFRRWLTMLAVVLRCDCDERSVREWETLGLRVRKGKRGDGRCD